MMLSYCGETVRKQDPDRFLLSMFAPPDAREALWALYAFNHEIAKTREVVTETQLGLIRLQWWRDEIARIYEGRGGVAGHMVLKPLSEAIIKYRLPKEIFDHLIFAREFDLEDRQPANLEGMIHYADFTSTPLTTLSLLCLPSAKVDDDTVKRISTGYALTGLLRAVPFHLSQCRCYLPSDMTPPAHELYDGKKTQELQSTIKAVVQEAVKRLQEPCASPFLGLHASLASMYLKQIESVGGDVFSARLRAPPVMRELRLWWHSLIRR